jgi:hypothetical protein
LPGHRGVAARKCRLCQGPTAAHARSRPTPTSIRSAGVSEDEGRRAGVANRSCGTGDLSRRSLRRRRAAVRRTQLLCATEVPAPRKVDCSYEGRSCNRLGIRWHSRAAWAVSVFR